MEPTLAVPAGLTNKWPCGVPGTHLMKRAETSSGRVCILQEGRTRFIYQLGLLSSDPRKIKSASETGAEASTAPTEIENLVVLSANDISALPKWSAAVVKGEQNRDVITGRTLSSSIFL